jgi:hypothetical protein
MSNGVLKSHAVLFSLLSLVAVLVVSFAAAGGEQSEQTRQRVQDLVRQLGSDDADRQAEATTSLLKLGPDILPLLEKPGMQLTQAQEERLIAVRKALREALAQKSLVPHLVTVKNDAITLSAALAELKKQTEIQVDDQRHAKTDDPTIKLSLERVTFWQALDAIAKEADVRVALFAPQSRIALIDGPSIAVPVSYSGLFRTRVTRLVGVSDLESGARFSEVTFEVAWEPGIQPLFFEVAPESLVAQDGRGNALAPTEQTANRVPVGRPGVTLIRTRLEAPRRGAEKLSLLEGSLATYGPSKMLTFNFDKLATPDPHKPDEAPKQVQEGVTMRVRDFKADSDGWTLAIALEYPPESPDFESFESWLVNNEIKLVKKDGKAEMTANGGYDIDEQAGHRALLTYRFVEEADHTLGKPEDWKLVYRTAGAITRMKVPFRFENVPLP